MYVREYMSTDVITVTQDTPLHLAQTQMRDHNIQRLPVVDETGKLVGLVTERRLREVVASLASSIAAGELHKPLTSLTVGEVMESKVLTTSPDAPLADIGALGIKHHVGAFPVV
ncbi:MAG: CBS domain-containing protein, partial [Syntrophales bacterium]